VESDSEEDYYVKPKKSKKGKKNELFGGYFAGGLFSVPNFGK
jgi:hypothetical protein